jgi:hypothetical protein
VWVLDVLFAPRKCIGRKVVLKLTPMRVAGRVFGHPPAQPERLPQA